MRKYWLAAGAAMVASGALAAPTYIHAGRPIDVPGKAVRPAGVKIAFGTDAGVSKHGRNADEFELMVKYGMPPAETIKAATVNAADLLGLASEIGTIEAGKSADIIAVDGDPLSDVTVLKKVGFVMARGEVIKSE